MSNGSRRVLDLVSLFTTLLVAVLCDITAQFVSRTRLFMADYVTRLSEVAVTAPHDFGLKVTTRSAHYVRKMFSFSQ